MNTLDRVEVSKTVRAYLEKLRPKEPSVRAKLDYGFYFQRQSVELLEIRSRMGGKPGKTEHAFAKATFVRALNVWKVYWMRGNLKWHPYEPPTARSLAAFLEFAYFGQVDHRHGRSRSPCRTKPIRA